MSQDIIPKVQKDVIRSCGENRYKDYIKNPNKYRTLDEIRARNRDDIEKREQEKLKKEQEEKEEQSLYDDLNDNTSLNRAILKQLHDDNHFAEQNE